MTSADGQRLERALEIFLAVESGQLAERAAIAAHPELADLLQPMFEPAPADPATETLGEFELLREVGRGGMGVVYEARQRSLGRRVALKVLAGDWLAEPLRLARFRREAELLAAMDHPGIVRVFGAGTNPPRPWLAMEFVDGRTLDTELAAWRNRGGHRGSSRRDAVRIVLTIAETLVHLHGQGILHRDVKPSNILLANDGRVLLGDFGLARSDQHTNLTQTELRTGTPHYLAPEYLLAGTQSPAADVFALGVVLYEATTLARPFDGQSSAMVVRAVLHDEPQDPRRLCRELPRDLAAITLRALAKLPEHRYPTMAALADDLRNFLDLLPIVARPPSPTQRLLRWARREPWRAALGVAALALLGTFTYLASRLPDLAAGRAAALHEQYEDAIAEAFLRRGGGQRELALAAASQALALQPTAGEAIAVHAMVTLRFAGPADALAELETALAQPHDDHTALQRLRALLLGRLGRADERDTLAAALPAPTTQIDYLLAAGLHIERRTADDLAAARNLISTATRLGPPRLLVHGQWAAAADPAAAREVATTLLRLWPQHPMALHEAARHLQWFDPAQAAATQRLALDRGLVDPFAWHNLAAYASKAGDGPSAVAAALQAMAEPTLPEAQRPGLLQVFVDHAPGQLDTAVASWLRLHPDSRLAQRELGRSRSAIGDHARAIALLQPLADDPAADAETLFVYAWALDNDRRDAECLLATERLSALAPQDRRAHGLRLRVLDRTGDAAARLAELQRYTRAVPLDLPAWRELAQRLLDDGSASALPAALAAAMQADQLAGGDDVEVLRTLAAAHQALGETTAASLVRQRLDARGRGR
jgi:predicted Ser/Thr protein kinase